MGTPRGEVSDRLILPRPPPDARTARYFPPGARLVHTITPLTSGVPPMSRRPLAAVLLALTIGCLSASAAAPPQTPRVTAVPDSVRAALKLDKFYQKYTDYNGLPILSSSKVSDAGLLEARYLIGQMLAGRDDICKAMVRNRVRFVVMSPKEMTTDVPEQRNMKPKEYWDKRARGLGGRVTSC